VRRLTTSITRRTELAHPASNGIDVHLFWDEPTNRVTLSLLDARTDDRLEFKVEELALPGRDRLFRRLPAPGRLGHAHLATNKRRQARPQDDAGAYDPTATLRLPEEQRGPLNVNASHDSHLSNATSS